MAESASHLACYKIKPVDKDYCTLIDPDALDRVNRQDWKRVGYTA